MQSFALHLYSSTQTIVDKHQHCEGVPQQVPLALLMRIATEWNRRQLTIIKESHDVNSGNSDNLAESIHHPRAELTPHPLTELSHPQVELTHPQAELTPHPQVELTSLPTTEMIELTSPLAVDPRERTLRELFLGTPAVSCRAPLNINTAYHNRLPVRHQYNLASRRSGTIYDKKTFAEFHNMERYVQKPPDAWFRYHGGSEDYINGTLHFPSNMPDDAEDLASHTIRRQKMSSQHFCLIAAQYAFLERARQQQQQSQSGQPLRAEEEVCDESVQYMAEIFSRKRSYDSREFTPRKISVSQTKELLHAWVAVYVFGKKELIQVLDFYMYAGYVVTITQKKGGVHEK